MTRMSSLEFTYWRERFKREPFGYDIDNFRMGQICAAIVNVTRTSKADMTKPSDFYPTSPKEKPELTDRQRAQLEKKRNGSKRRNSHS